MPFQFGCKGTTNILNNQILEKNDYFCRSDYTGNDRKRRIDAWKCGYVEKKNEALRKVPRTEGRKTSSGCPEHGTKFIQAKYESAKFIQATSTIGLYKKSPIPYG